MLLKVCSGSSVPLVTLAVVGLTLINPLERWGLPFSPVGAVPFDSRVPPVTAAIIPT